MNFVRVTNFQANKNYLYMAKVVDGKFLEKWDIVVNLKKKLSLPYITYNRL